MKRAVRRAGFVEQRFDKPKVFIRQIVGFAQELGAISA